MINYFNGGMTIPLSQTGQPSAVNVADGLGAIVYGSLLTDGAGQDINAASTTQIFSLGTRAVTLDGRVFRYSYADTGGVQSEFGAINPVVCISSAVVPTQKTGDGAVSANSVTVTIAAGGGVAANGAVALNELVGGYIWIGNGVAQHPQCRMITANTAISAGGGTISVYFDRALTGGVTAATTYAEVFANPYAHVKSGNVVNSNVVSFIGIPAVTCAAANYFWLQTWGPCWITSDGNTGKVANGRELYFQTNGSVVSSDEITFTSNHPIQQRAGFAMDANVLNSSNSPLCMLQISI